MKHGQFPKGGRAEIRATSEPFRGRTRFDVREYFAPQEGAELIPTRKGINLPAPLVPQLRALLEKAEHDLLDAGELTPAHYRLAGLAPPAEPQETDTGEPPVMELFPRREGALPLAPVPAGAGTPARRRRVN